MRFKIIYTDHLSKFFLIILSSFILYYRPLYGFFLIVIFFFEYLWLINYIYNIYKNFDKYYRIEVPKVDISDKNCIEIWIEYNKIQAFQRVYGIFSKKKLTLKNIIVVTFVIILNVPLKFLKLLKYFLINNKKSFKEGLKILYTSLYYLLKENKLEVLNKKIYLNCFTIGKLLKKIDCKNMSEQEVFNFLHDLRLVANNFYNYELMNQSFVTMKLSKIETKEGVLVNAPHYAHEENNNVLHATSKMPKEVALSQKWDFPLPSLIKKNAVNPVTIISQDIKNIKTSDSYLIVPIYEINSIKFNNLHSFNLTPEQYTYMFEKDKTYSDLLQTHLKEGKILDESLCSELRTNCYTHNFINISDKQIIEEIKSIKNHDI